MKKWKKRGWQVLKDEEGYVLEIFYDNRETQKFLLNVEDMYELHSKGVLLCPSRTNPEGGFLVSPGRYNWGCFLTFPTEKMASEFYETKILPIIVMKKLNNEECYG
jgi:hypothetical protein